jgi:general secretion pathway protein E
MLTLNNINPKATEIENFNIEEGIKFSLLPGVLDNKTYFFTTQDHLIDALNFYNKTNTPLEIILTDKDSFNRLLNRFLEIKTQKELQNSDLEAEEDLSLDDFIKNGLDILDSENSAPIIKFVNSMFFQAVKKRASDIHIETHESFGTIRFRIDGVLITQATIQKKHNKPCNQ